MRERPEDFDTTVYAENSARMCALPADAQLCLGGLNGAAALA